MHAIKVLLIALGSAMLQQTITGPMPALVPTIPGFMQLYTSSGPVPAGSNAKLFIQTVTSTSSGTWSLGYSVAGFTIAPVCHADVPSPGGGLGFFLQANVNAGNTTTTASGTVVYPPTVALSGMPIALYTTPTAVNIWCLGW